MPRKRADVLLVECGFFESRAKARAAIEAGGVTADGRPDLKPFEHSAAVEKARAPRRRPPPGITGSNGDGSDLF